MPWQDNNTEPPPVTDADGTRWNQAAEDAAKTAADIKSRYGNRPQWWGQYHWPAGETINRPNAIPTHARATPSQQPATTIQPPPVSIDDPAGDGGPEAFVSSIDTWDGYITRKNATRDRVRKNRPRAQLPPRQQRTQEEIEREFNKRRRDNFRKAEEEMKRSEPPRGTLLPHADDFDINQDPNESDQERDGRLRRERWLRGTQAIAGGATVPAAIITAKERAKWLAKNSATTQNRMYEPPSIPSSGHPSDLDPSTKPPEQPIYPGKPEVTPPPRSSPSWIRPVANTNRASFAPDNSNGVQAMDCSC
jgi:hypothetical protein